MKYRDLRETRSRFYAGNVVAVEISKWDIKGGVYTDKDNVPLTDEDADAIQPLLDKLEKKVTNMFAGSTPWKGFVDSDQNTDDPTSGDYIGQVRLGVMYNEKTHKSYLTANFPEVDGIITNDDIVAFMSGIASFYKKMTGGSNLASPYAKWDLHYKKPEDIWVIEDEDYNDIHVICPKIHP